MKVYLMQHGEAKSKEEDPQRPLSDPGKNNIRKVSEYAAKINLSIAEIWHSDKLRAQQTAGILAEALGMSDKVKECQGLAPNDNVMDLSIQLMSKEENVAIVGHLPFLGKLACLLLCGSESAHIINFKMGGIVCLNNKDDLHNWTLDWMIIPEIIE